MTSKLKCPYCSADLESTTGSWEYGCTNTECLSAGTFCGTKELWHALIQAKQDLDFFIKEQVRTQTALIERTKELDKCQKDLEQSEKCCSAWETQALDYKAETIALSGKLEIAREALKGTVSYYDHYAEFDGEISWDGVALIMRNDAHEALKQIEHKD